MALLDWLPAVTTMSLLTVALWLGRNLILNRLAKSVEHEFDAKLETLRAQLRDSEERLKADLRARETEIAVLRSGAMTAMTSRQVALDQRRLLAVDQLWSAVMELAPGKTLLAVMVVLNFEVAAKRSEREPRLRQAFDFVGSAFAVKDLDLSGAAKARPFLSPMAWATYSALLAMILHAAMRLEVLKSGLAAKDLVNDEAIAGVIKAALPHAADFIDEHGAASHYFLVEQLETKLLQELRAMLAGTEADKASIEQAAEILKRSSEVIENVTTSQYSTDSEDVPPTKPVKL